MALTAREYSIVALVCDGQTNALIASELGIQPQVVKNYLGKIFLKAGVRNRVELAVWGMKSQMGETVK